MNILDEIRNSLAGSDTAAVLFALFWMVIALIVVAAVLPVAVWIMKHVADLIGVAMIALAEVR